MQRGAPSKFYGEYTATTGTHFLPLLSGRGSLRNRPGCRTITHVRNTSHLRNRHLIQSQLPRSLCCRLRSAECRSAGALAVLVLVQRQSSYPRPKPRGPERACASVLGALSLGGPGTEALARATRCSEQKKGTHGSLPCCQCHPSRVPPTTSSTPDAAIRSAHPPNYSASGLVPSSSTTPSSMQAPITTYRRITHSQLGPVWASRLASAQTLGFCSPSPHSGSDTLVYTDWSAQLASYSFPSFHGIPRFWTSFHPLTLPPSGRPSFRPT